MKFLLSFLVFSMLSLLAACDRDSSSQEAPPGDAAGAPAPQARPYENVEGLYHNAYFGARAVSSTPLQRGTLFAAPDGSGDLCSEVAPCAIRQAFGRLSPGDVLFLRGGVYPLRASLGPPENLSGTPADPIVIESYPGELAILDGGIDHADQITDENRHTQLKLRHNDHFRIRRIEVRRMPAEGIAVFFSNHVRVEGCHVHHNIGTGIAVNGGEWREDRPNYTIPYKYGYNTISDNVVHHNSDVETAAAGDNADGIWIGSGRYNVVVHNTLFANSDDGIDTWRSNHSRVAWNFAYDNGRGDRGNGNGIKAGGNLNPDAGNGVGSRVEYNIAYANRRHGFNYNAGRDVTFTGNVAYANRRRGYVAGDDTRLTANVAMENEQSPINVNATPQQAGNSWQLGSIPQFRSTDPQAADFLVAGVSTQLFLIGDSTVHNHDFPDGNGGFFELGWGDALVSLARTPETIHNMARSGASSVSFDNDGRGNNWARTTALMSDLEQQAQRRFHLQRHDLLIQFGHNDQSPDAYEAKLRDYIAYARDHRITPVLVTPVNRLHPGVRYHQAYVARMRALAAELDVPLVDLNEKSFREFRQAASDVELMARFAYDDHTHFSPAGARIVAGWVVGLICDDPDPDLRGLCGLFGEG